MRKRRLHFGGGVFYTMDDPVVYTGREGKEAWRNELWKRELWRLWNGGLRERRRRNSPAGSFRRGPGCGNFDCRSVSGGCADVPGCVFADRLRLRLLPALRTERRRHMNIVVWKSPKMLRGILKKIFKV